LGSFGMLGYARITVGTPRENKKLMDLIREFSILPATSKEVC